MNSMNYGTKLKDLRIKNGLTQEEIASQMNIARITYNHYETQEKIIPIERLNDLCNYYNVSIDYIFDINNNLYKFNKDINKILSGIRIKEFRKENKLTQVKLAELLNTTHSVICEYEKGRNLISTAFLYMICKKYNISADYLLGKIDNPKYLK